MRPQKLSGAPLEEVGDELQNTVMAIDHHAPAIPALHAKIILKQNFRLSFLIQNLKIMFHTLLARDMSTDGTVQAMATSLLRGSQCRCQGSALQ